MKKLFQTIRNHKIWSGVSGLLVVLGFSAYVPLVDVGREASQSSVEIYCDNNPDADSCKKEE